MKDIKDNKNRLSKKYNFYKSENPDTRSKYKLKCSYCANDIEKNEIKCKGVNCQIIYCSEECRSNDLDHNKNCAK